MDQFDDIKLESFKKFIVHFDLFNSPNSAPFYIDYTNKSQWILNYNDNAKFNIVPVAVSRKYGNPRGVTLYTENTIDTNGLIHHELAKIVKKLDLPRKFKINPHTGEFDGIFEVFRFAYKVTALVCDKLNGITFMNIDILDGRVIWCVITKSYNKEGQKLLKSINKYKDKITLEKSNKWYSDRLFN